jgi:hypothetical protein
MSYLAFTRKFTCVVVAGILGAGPATAGVFISEDAAHSTSLLAELTHNAATAASALIVVAQVFLRIQMNTWNDLVDALLSASKWLGNGVAPLVGAL